MNKLKIVLCCLLVGITYTSIQAQQFFFSQFYINKLNLNPAYAVLNGGLTLATTNRTQWLSVPGGFTTSGGSASYERVFFKKSPVHWGVGLGANHSIEGSAILKTTQLKPTVAIGYLGGEGGINVALGLSRNSIWQNYNKDHLVFSDQLNPYNNDIENSSVNLSAEHLPIKYAQHEVGVVVNKNGKNDWTIGIKWSNLFSNKDKISLNNVLGSETTHIEGFGVYVIDTKGLFDEVTILTNIKYYDVQNTELLHLDIGGYTVWKSILTGVFMRTSKRAFSSTNAVSFHLGYIKDINNGKLKFVYSIDANLGGLTGVNVTDGWPGTNMELGMVFYSDRKSVV